MLRSGSKPSSRSWLIPTLGLAALAVGCVGAWEYVRHQHLEQKSAQQETKVVETDSVRPVKGDNDALDVPADVAESLGVQTAQVRTAPRAEPLRLAGSLFLDSNRLVHVHARFPGEVVAIGQFGGEGRIEHNEEVDGVRPLRLNDPVKKGQLLAVIWSKEVGEKKSDLVDSLSQLAVDQLRLERLKSLEKGVVPERSVQDAERNREADLIAVERAERTLRSWRLTDAEIAEVYSEADRIHAGGGNTTSATDTRWAEVEVRAALDGVILERNVAVGDIVDTDLVLFKVADLSKLAVMAHIYEEDMSQLRAMPPDKRQWLISPKSDLNSQPISGRFEIISNVIDPNQHTGTVIGWVDNKDEKLQVGQFITATIELPIPTDEVAVPLESVIDEGATSAVFVADGAEPHRVWRRKVLVHRRCRGLAFVASRVSDDESKRGVEPLVLGEWVISSGNVELSGALKSFMSDRPPAPVISTAKAP